MAGPPRLRSVAASREHRRVARELASSRRCAAGLLSGRQEWPRRDGVVDPSPAPELGARGKPSRYRVAVVAGASSSPPATSGTADDKAAAPLPRTWSNPTGDVLREIVPGKVWEAPRAHMWTGIDVGGRMGVVRLADGSVWVHSPVPLDQPLREAIDAIGPLRSIVSPNYEHSIYAQQWIDAYPAARAYGCPGIKEKKPKVGIQEEVGWDTVAPEAWQGEFDLAWLDYEHNPFNRKPFFNEVVFHHRPSGVLFVTDLWWNYPADSPGGTWLFKQGMDRVYRPFYRTFMLARRERYQEQVRRILNWEWDALVPCHGHTVVTGGKMALAEALLS
eukprot:SM000061S19227  [mRNA]  locus=s61:220750:222172:- [translate_table: standard]